ncbi:MAG: site-specific DNA-methyltransferase [Candidatus Bathyarchaeia archaeon]
MNDQEVQATLRKKERLNKLDGKTWERYSISIWEIVKSREESKLKHPAMFPAELCRRLIEIYTKKGDVVLDPFMGSGSAIIAARDLERKGIGFDINPDFVELAKKRASQQKLIHLGVEEPDVYCEDAKVRLMPLKIECQQLKLCGQAMEVSGYRDKVDLLHQSPL